MLQNRYCVAALQHRLLYNAVVSIPTKEHSDQAVASDRRAPGSRGKAGQFFRAVLFTVALFGMGVLAAACGGGPSRQHAVARLRKTTTTVPSAAQGGSTANPSSHALAFVKCMRAHGDTNMPDPVISGHGVHITVDVNAPHFTTAYNACRHLLPDNGVSRSTITPADQADYLKAAACMRSHGVPNFPDPVFYGSSVRFESRSPIDTGSPQFKSALATCQKLIPAGLPYSSHRAS